MRSKKKNTSDAKQNKVKENKNAKKTNKKKHSVLKKVILIIFALIVVAILTGVGIFAGIFFGDQWAITKEELIANGNAEVYDSEEKQIALLSAGEGDGNRKVITIDQMGKYTPNAYIAIEDKRFYEHSGVDILRTAKATISYILNGGDSSNVGGGSTITQQLVKNIMKDKADSGTEGIERKIREMSRAYHIESLLNKTQIIEKYLNIIFVGGNDLHGVEYGARYYFDKSAKDLDLAESAFLAGINNAPNMYDPYDKEEDHTELIKSRTKLVLQFMKEQNRISDNPEEAEQLYNEAVAKVDNGFEFKKGKIEIGNNSYFVVEAVNQAAKDLAEEKDIDIDEATSIIKSSGYRLYTTQVSSIQNLVIKEMAKDKYVETRTTTVKNEDGESEKVKIRTNAGMTIIEPSTGYVVAMGGDLQEDQGEDYNYATSKERQTGSSIKPLANIAPGLEEKIITASTVYDDVRTKFKGLTYIPKNAGGYQGLCTVRKAIETSSNIVNLKIMINVGTKTAIQYLNEFGLDTYVEGEDGLTLAIGGATHGSSTLQMAAAYATLANGGEYIEPTFYKKLVDSEGNTILEPQQEKRRVISEANAFIISDILTDVVTGYSGTAPECAISGMDVAAKTGTTESGTDKWLCGYTPYYAAAVWYGYGYTNQWSVNNTSAAKNIWAGVMKQVHKELEGKRFSKPSGVVTAKVCRDSGKLATANCKNTYTEYFVKGTVPKACDGHVKLDICKESGMIATEFCLETEEKLYTAKPEKENNVNWSPVSGSDKYEVPEEKCNIHTEESNTIIISNVIGKTETEAKTILADLNIQVIYETHSDQKNGIVIRQSLAEGTKVQKGTAIVITINRIESKPPVEDPTNTEKPSENTESPGNNEVTNSENNEQVSSNNTETSNNTQ